MARLLALAGVVLLLTMAVLMPREERVDTLQMAIGLGPGAESFVLARERGLLPKDRVQLIDMSWPSAAMRAFGNGVVDAAVLSLDEVLRLREGGHDLRVVMVLDVSAGADVVLGGDEVKKLADLRGKRVGCDGRSSGMVLLESALASVGMRGSDIEFVPLSPSEMAASWAEHRMDAMVLAEPWATRVQRSGGGTSLYDSRQMKLPIYRVLVASSQAVKSQRDELRMVMAAYRRGNQELQLAGEGGVSEVVLRREGLNEAEFRQCMTRMKTVTAAESARLLKPGGDLVRHASGLEQMMRSAGLLERLPATQSWIDASLQEVSR